MHSYRQHIGTVFALSTLFALVVGSLSSAASGPIHTSEERAAQESSIRWAERVFRDASEFGNGAKKEWLWRRSAGEAREAFADVLAKYGADVRAYDGLARSDMLLGKYDAAVEDYNKALTIQPNDPSIRRKLDKAKELAEVSKSASKLLPASYTVLRIVIAPGVSPRTRWLVLSSKFTNGPDRAFPLYSDNRLTLFEGSAGNLRKIWQSAQIGFSPRKNSPFSVSSVFGLPAGEFNDVQLLEYDLTGDGVKEIIVPQVFIGADWLPSHLDVFQWKKGHLIRILGANGISPSWIQDLNHDGSWEVISVDKSIGYELSHAEQPGWESIYAYKRGSYQLADEDFPREYIGIQRDILGALKNHPNDPELLKYLGMTYQIMHRPREARTALRRSEAAYRKALGGETDPYLRGFVERELGDLKRLAASK